MFNLARDQQVKVVKVAQDQTDTRPYWQRQQRTLQGWEFHRRAVQAWKKRNPEKNHLHGKRHRDKQRELYGADATKTATAWIKRASLWNEIQGL